ncbi:hypothetical protein HMPREF9946_01718 [Acetobacteraceae bacterium AT-5844]|nr:hypothetical protein HMPREF9946_01718 [Acetobacteraceae bacterium AT-5844]
MGVPAVATACAPRYRMGIGRPRPSYATVAGCADSARWAVNGAAFQAYVTRCWRLN